jgi:hypothetical protein
LNPEFPFSEFIRSAILCLLCVAVLGTSAAADSKSPEELEHEVKAAFIYNFMKFIEWPGAKKIAADSKTTDPVRIAVLGKHPSKKSLEMILDKTVQGRAIQLVELESFERYRQRFSNHQTALDAYKNQYVDRLAQCHMLFICDSEKTSFTETLKLAEGSAVVTISDLPDFAAANGMIGFVMENKKVRFEINLDAVQTEKIKISSQLLGLAKRVYKAEGK